MDFDEKVARSIVETHRNVKKNDHFSKWVKLNYCHLEHMYSMTDLTIDFDKFCTFVYDHSD